MTAVTERLLLFDVHGSRYALALEEVAEVLDLLPGFPIPRAADFYVGTVNFHGCIVAVLDLAAFFGTGSTQVGGKLIVLDPELASLAFAVGPAVDIVSTDAILEEEAGDDPLVEKVLLLADGEVQRLHVGNFLAKLEELLAA